MKTATPTMMRAHIMVVISKFWAHQNRTAEFSFRAAQTKDRPKAVSVFAMWVLIRLP
jgi:hypothetical protein